ncbi:MAG TPA: hypothetical protein VFE65_13460 [Pseudonocardia sp.]|nr:hypothetical protein [Pseudonocardia sp.]
MSTQNDDPRAPRGDRSTELERSVDELEERVVGRRVDQQRRESDDPGAPAFEQDLDSEDTSRADPDAPV